ncbi:unnamed protein product [Amoebophrya sp. A120]|nr:unnamed protein product [Amoebophrya sp. A120]|eukprot:GSA120T00020956001.1
MLLTTRPPDRSTAQSSSGPVSATRSRNMQSRLQNTTTSSTAQEELPPREGLAGGNSVENDQELGKATTTTTLGLQPDKDKQVVEAELLDAPPADEQEVDLSSAANPTAARELLSETKSAKINRYRLLQQKFVTEYRKLLHTVNTFRSATFQVRNKLDKAEAILFTPLTFEARRRGHVINVVENASGGEHQSEEQIQVKKGDHKKHDRPLLPPSWTSLPLLEYGFYEKFFQSPSAQLCLVSDYFTAVLSMEERKGIWKKLIGGRRNEATLREITCLVLLARTEQLPRFRAWVMQINNRRKTKGSAAVVVEEPQLPVAVAEGAIVASTTDRQVVGGKVKREKPMAGTKLLGGRDFEYTTDFVSVSSLDRWDAVLEKFPPKSEQQLTPSISRNEEVADLLAKTAEQGRNQDHAKPKNSFRAILDRLSEFQVAEDQSVADANNTTLKAGSSVGRTDHSETSHDPHDILSHPAFSMRTAKGTPILSAKVRALLHVKRFVSASALLVSNKKKQEQEQGITSQNLLRAKIKHVDEEQQQQETESVIANQRESASAVPPAVVGTRSEIGRPVAPQKAAALADDSAMLASTDNINRGVTAQQEVLQIGDRSPPQSTGFGQNTAGSPAVVPPDAASMLVASPAAKASTVEEQSRQEKTTAGAQLQTGGASSLESVSESGPRPAAIMSQEATPTLGAATEAPSTAEQRGLVVNSPTSQPSSSTLAVAAPPASPGPTVPPATGSSEAASARTVPAVAVSPPAAASVNTTRAVENTKQQQQGEAVLLTNATDAELRFHVILVDASAKLGIKKSGPPNLEDLQLLQSTNLKQQILVSKVTQFQAADLGRVRVSDRIHALDGKTVINADKLYRGVNFTEREFRDVLQKQRPVAVEFARPLYWKENFKKNPLVSCLFLEMPLPSTPAAAPDVVDGAANSKNQQQMNQIKLGFHKIGLYAYASASSKPMIATSSGAPAKGNKGGKTTQLQRATKPRNSVYFVTRVKPGGLAEKAGVKVGDRIGIRKNYAAEDHAVMNNQNQNARICSFDFEFEQVIKASRSPPQLPEVQAAANKNKPLTVPAQDSSRASTPVARTIAKLPGLSGVVVAGNKKQGSSTANRQPSAAPTPTLVFVRPYYQKYNYATANLITLESFDPAEKLGITKVGSLDYEKSGKCAAFVLLNDNPKTSSTGAGATSTDVATAEMKNTATTTTAAQRCGINNGDRIVSVNGIPVEEIGSDIKFRQMCKKRPVKVVFARDDYGLVYPDAPWSFVGTPAAPGRGPVQPARPVDPGLSLRYLGEPPY